MKALQSFLQLFPASIAQAHCDVPCGVYEPDSMTWAAETCFKLVEKMEALELPAQDDKHHVLEFHNTMSRSVVIKEEFAQICKKEALILWTDYFKAEHLDRWPDLHDKVWNLTKQCSVVKRSVSVVEATKLKEMVAELANIFHETKK